MLRTLRNPENRRVVTILAFAFFIHALVMKAAFDIYFSSPIDHGMKPVRSTDEPPAKRLVLIVGDGLRAEAIFGKGQTTKAPFLTKLRKLRASWGISNTRVPTESRPGHVALLGGIYEDPSAILSGWQKNPVYFDSVINQSTNTWGWGSPDIIHMFNRDKSPHIHMSSYDAQMEDFGKKNTSVVDLWVFDEVTAFLREKKECSDCFDVYQSGNLFFLHLLGIDTAGHGFKPESFEYMDNIRIVDANIKQIEKLFEETFQDNSTAYIFTADHGMTDWGSHGAGSDHETKTPFIAWGAGVKVEDIQKDINQVDIAPLISSLIGINIPINSVGKLPYEYVDTTIGNLSKMMISNLRQLLETFNVKRFRRMHNSIRFVPFYGITSEAIERKMKFINSLMEFERFGQLKFEYDGLSQFLIKGADYYHNYYQLPILMAITIGIVAWIIYLATYNMDIPRISKNAEKMIFYIQIFIFIPFYMNIAIVIYVQSLPFMYYIYFMFPTFMCQMLVRRYAYILHALRLIKDFGLKFFLMNCFVYIAGLRLLVDGFRHRDAYNLVMFILPAFICFSKRLSAKISRFDKVAFTSLSAIISIFPYMPVMKTSSNVFVYLAGYMLWWAVYQKIVNHQFGGPSLDFYRVRIIDVQHLLMKLVPLYTLSVEVDLITSDSPIKYISWIIAFYPISMIFSSETNLLLRLFSIFLGFAPFYMMVTTNFEFLFLGFYSILLVVWVMIESKGCGIPTILAVDFKNDYTVVKGQTVDDFRRAFIFIVLIFLGFFGTGNIASLNSFNPMWVRCFLTVFSPFKMTGLILLRIMVPFIFATCAFKAINLLRRGETLCMFCIVLLFSDLMLLELLYTITNVGSWLQIGMSLSHFIIMEAFVVILLLLYGIAHLLTTKVWYNAVNYHLVDVLA